MDISCIHFDIFDYFVIIVKVWIAVQNLGVSLSLKLMSNIKFR
jgi:hypothetical protein